MPMREIIQVAILEGILNNILKKILKINYETLSYVNSFVILRFLFQCKQL